MIRLVRLLLVAMLLLLVTAGWFWRTAEVDRRQKSEALGRIVVLDAERRVLLERIKTAPPEQVPIIVSQLQRLDFTLVALAADPVMPATTRPMAPAQPPTTSTTTPATTTTTGTTVRPTPTTTTTTEPPAPKPPRTVTVPDPPPPDPPPTTEPQPPTTTSTSSPRRVCPPVAVGCL